jgi:hypothetical protein
MRWSSVASGLVVPRTFTFRRARRLACAAAAVAAATTALPRPGARCFSRIAAPTGRVQWPDLRLWVQRLPDGTCVIARHRSPEATTAFDAYSQPAPGTREICIGGQCFYAFSGPRLGAEHLTVWRRLDDVQSTAAAWQNERDAGVLPFELDNADLPVRVIPCAERPQLTAAVWCWDEQDRRDPNRYLEDGTGGGSWMYWLDSPIITGVALCDPQSLVLGALTEETLNRCCSYCGPPFHTHKGAECGEDRGNSCCPNDYLPRKPARVRLLCSRCANS